METVRRGVFPDSTRLRKVTQRRFHTAWQELLGEPLQICPTVGRELTRDVVVGNLEMSREAACDAIERNEPGGMIQQSAQWDLWWIRQWENTQSNYRLQNLEEKDRRRVEAVIEAFDPAVAGTESRATNAKREYQCARRCQYRFSDAAFHSGT